MGKKNKSKKNENGAEQRLKNKKALKGTPPDDESSRKATEKTVTLKPSSSRSEQTHVATKRKKMRPKQYIKGSGKPLEEEPFYHGRMPRADVVTLLKKEGDFIVRTTQKTDTTDRLAAISVKWKNEVHHVIPSSRDCADGKRYFMDNKYEFDSIADLVRYYFDNGDPLCKLLPAVLVTPVPKPHWELCRNQIELDKTKKLGEGAFGEVYCGTLCGRSVAVKISNNGKMPKSQLQEFMAEARLMRDYDHPNVVRFYGVVVVDPIMIVMEFMTGGSLLSHLRKNLGKTTAIERLQYCTDAALGVEYLHGKRCIHRDIAARNCLLGDGRVKISDFGLCREAPNLLNAYKMSAPKKVPIRWLSPETLATAVYSLKSDVFSFGILVWEVYSDGADPYAGINLQDIQQKVRDGHRMKHPQRMPVDVQNIVHCCWIANPDKRPTMPDIVLKLQRITTTTTATPPSSNQPSTTHSAPT